MKQMYRGNMEEKLSVFTQKFLFYLVFFIIDSNESHAKKQVRV